MCCAGPEEQGVGDWLVRSKKTKHSRERQEESYQSVVEADVSLQTRANVVELHNRYFSCSDGQDVLQVW